MTRKKSKSKAPALPVQTAPRSVNLLNMESSFEPAFQTGIALYRSLRESVPILDAAIERLTRLAVSFSVECDEADADKALQDFAATVPLSGSNFGLHAFASGFLEQLLTYGTSVGEIVLQNGRVFGLHQAKLSDIALRRKEDGFGIEVLAGGMEKQPVPFPELILLSTLRPEPGALHGTSLLRGLPFVSSILLRIFSATGQNWDRLGNVRFAVNYKPQNDSTDRAYAKERAMQVAKQWSEAMKPGNTIHDFVTVGDVQISAIGADITIPDSAVPVRQMLEQILAKTGLPPFLLGLSWSSTERMSTQQADLLTSELEAYRELLTPVILKICRTFLRLSGFTAEPKLLWNDITLQDRVELSRAKLYDAQAQQTLQSLKGKEEIH